MRAGAQRGTEKQSMASWKAWTSSDAVNNNVVRCRYMMMMMMMREKKEEEDKEGDDDDDDDADVDSQTNEDAVPCLIR